MTPIIRVDNLGKRYLLGSQQAAYGSLRDTLARMARSPVRAFQRAGPNRQEIWAVKDVGFEVSPGEAVGIIGRNGAGKSTLLKLLSRITEPTTGRIELYGRIASLLEVGTGFHPELSGRDNIFLNGAILGMGRREIAKKFDEIVAFAEVERFVDTPVKHFSSGMYLRLAFAVAAHLEPEILLVDEVLAVGDSRFQRKCLDKMQDVGKEGRTVLFVSHNMSAITRLCSRTILLDGGKVIGDGPSSQIVSAYLSSGLGTTAARVWNDPDTAPGNDIVRLCAVRVVTENGEVAEGMDIRRPIGVEIEYDVLQAGHVLVPNYFFHNEEGICAFGVSESDPEWRGKTRPEGRFASTVWIPGNLLAEGTLFVSAAISTMDPVSIHFYERDVVAFQVIDSMDGDSARGDYGGPIPGVVRPQLQWSTRSIAGTSTSKNRNELEVAR